jgi:ERCC4-type nuclease
MINAVIIDSREPRPIRELQIGGNAPMIQTLPTGDVWLACNDGNLIVERKTPGDLMASIADGRLFEQAAAMVKASPWAYVIVTGHLAERAGLVVESGRVTNWKMRSVQGALLTIQEIGVVVAYCDGDREFASTCEWLAGRDRGVVKVHPQRRDVVMQSPAEAFLCALPGVSETRAAALLRYAGTAAWALDWLTRYEMPADRVPGIGEGTRKRARLAFGLADDEYLAVCNRQEEGNSSE